MSKRLITFDVDGDIRAPFLASGCYYEAEEEASRRAHQKYDPIYLNVVFNEQVTESQLQDEEDLGHLLYRMVGFCGIECLDRMHTCEELDVSESFLDDAVASEERFQSNELEPR